MERKIIQQFFLAVIDICALVPLAFWANKLSTDTYAVQQCAISDLTNADGEIDTWTDTTGSLVLYSNFVVFCAILVCCPMCMATLCK